MAALHRSSAPLPGHADVVVVGAGFAGLATAAALVSQGLRNVVVCEAEPVPGAHGSGRNAAMARRVIDDPHLARLAVRSVALIEALSGVTGRPLLSRCGGLLLGADADIARLADVCASIPALRRDHARLTADAIVQRVPALRGADLGAGGLFTAGCGVVDIHALLTTFTERARAGGAVLGLKTPVTGVEVAGDRVVGVTTPHGTIATERLVNAAGFGVNAIAAAAGLGPLPFNPVRRHLFVTTADATVARDAPFVWDVTRGFYFRPEGDGLLLCACDASPWPPEAPPTDPATRELLAEKLTRCVPGLARVRPARMWAGLRVLTPDGRFVIGPDPRLRGFFWVAGLGGHGMTTSAGVGELAAIGVLEGSLPEPLAAAFAPERFLH